jgi:hypothetical protein
MKLRLAFAVMAHLTTDILALDEVYISLFRFLAMFITMTD